jgi:zinc protease
MKFPITAMLWMWALSIVPLASQAQSTQEFMLKNGMKVIVKEDHRAPTVAHMVWYKVGSVD